MGLGRLSPGIPIPDDQITAPGAAKSACWCFPGRFVEDSRGQHCNPAEISAPSMGRGGFRGWNGQCFYLKDFLEEYHNLATPVKTSFFILWRIPISCGWTNRNRMKWAVLLRQTEMFFHVFPFSQARNIVGRIADLGRNQDPLATQQGGRMVYQQRSEAFCNNFSSIPRQRCWQNLEHMLVNGLTEGKIYRKP